MVVIKHLKLGLFVLLLAGCSALDQRESGSASWQTHSERLRLLQQWTANGKIAVRMANAAESASLIWQQDRQNSSVQLSGPLGMGATTIHSDGQKLEIHQGDLYRMIDISTPDAILLNTGWDLPLQALSYWLKGVPAPNSKVQRLELDPQTELLKSLSQDNWDISYQRYQVFQGFTLPARLQIQRGATHAKIIISRWQTLPT
ncbi:MAG: lipoprotein insertase outer membrane protein LolB [Halioglobus sp.]|nr:lipoprotein insertase outer membrane protein LolB [Halioglobus sp.]